MKIAAIRSHVVWTSRERSWLFVEVEADNGLVGWGEASQSRNDAGVVEELQRLQPQYLGENPLDLIERRQQLLDWPYAGRTLFAAVSALEQALWDLAGRQLGVPVYQLMGGRVHERLRTYANIGYAAASREPEALATAARAAVAAGFDALKFYPFGMRPRLHSAGEVERWIAHGVECVRAVREAVGDGVDILVDLMHQFQDFRQVRDIARRLDPYRLYWIEDPFVQDDPLQLVELRRTIGPRLAGGAPLLTRHGWRPLLEAGALDVVMPDVKWMGGIAQVRKLAAMAEVFGAMVSPHNASGPVANAACVHAGLTLAGFDILEYPWGVPAWRGALARGTEHLEGGYFPAPTAPGLGVDIDTELAARHRHPPAATAGGIELPRH